jgi:hypothetical protein
MGRFRLVGGAPCRTATVWQPFASRLVLTMRDVFRHYPARALSPAEHALVAEWLARAGDSALAYVASRAADDPAIYRCVVIVTKAEDGPSHLVHAPVGEDVWVAFTLCKPSKTQKFPTLRSALNSIRLVLVDGVSMIQQETSAAPE